MTGCALCQQRTDPGDPYHPACAQTLDDTLATIPQLYKSLGDALTPSGSSGARVSGSRTPPLPVRLEPLSLRATGGIITTLAAWENDLRAWRRLPPPPARALDDAALDQIVTILRAHLDWALTNWPNIREFAETAHWIHREASTTLGLRAHQLNIGNCPAGADTGQPCGQPLRADPHQNIIRCPRCHNTWTQDQWVTLGAQMLAVLEKQGLTRTLSSPPHAA